MVAVIGACGNPLDSGDDGPSGGPMLGFDTATSSYDETEGEIEVYIRLSEPANDVVTFWFEFGGSATNGDDYHGIGGLGLIPPGFDFASARITLFDDGLAEAAETIDMTISSPVHASLGVRRHTLTIRDNQLPRVTFEQAVSNSSEGSLGTIDLQVLPASPVPITVEYALSGTASDSDYALRAGTITIPAGVTTMPVSFEHIDDTLDEDDENVIITLANPTNAILGLYPENTHNIADDDAASGASFVVANQPAVTEGNSGTQVLTADVHLDRPSGRTVIVDLVAGDPQFYSATIGVDYTIATPTLVFPPGTTSQTVTFAIVGDTVQDGSDLVGITLKGNSAAGIAFPGTHSVRVDNDECYGTGAFKVCPDEAPSTDYTRDTLTFQNTSFNGGICADRQPPGWIESGQPDACFIVANNITIGTGRFEGFRPLVLVAINSITINTLLDAGSHYSGSVGIGGPGFDPPSCGAMPTLNMGAGGAGGSFLTAGGDGGSHGPSAPGGVAASAVASSTVLRGGCPGQQPRLNTSGPGGGALYLIAGSSITIAPNAVINASGASGASGIQGWGGTGGGSGGMIVMWAQSIQATQAHLLANGGGGGEGAEGNTQNAIQGGEVNFASPLTAAAGGSGTAGGDGGAGAVQGIAAVGGSAGNSSNGAGGGGGGLGYILVHPALTGAVVSPTPVAF